MSAAPIVKASACALVAALASAAPAAASAGAAHALAHPAARPPIASASLAQCATTGAQAERSATFAGEMTMVPGAARMQMRIELLERLPGEEAYRAVAAPQLSDWRSSAPGVKIFKYLKQVTNLSAPASYRANVRFRWLTAKGHLVRTQQLRTAVCEQPAPPATVTPSAPAAPVPGEAAPT